MNTAIALFLEKDFTMKLVKINVEDGEAMLALVLASSCHTFDQLCEVLDCHVSSLALPEPCRFQGLCFGQHANKLLWEVGDELLSVHALIFDPREEWNDSDSGT